MDVEELIRNTAAGRNTTANFIAAGAVRPGVQRSPCMHTYIGTTTEALDHSGLLGIPRVGTMRSVAAALNRHIGMG